MRTGLLSLAPPLARRLPFYYGWVIMGTVGLASFSSVAFGPGVVGALFSAMSEEFGWSRSVIPGAVLLGSVLVVVVGPVSGRLLDAYGARYVITVGSLVMTVCLVALGFVQSIVVFYVLFGAGYAMFTGITRVALAATTAHWFVRRRGIASVVGSASTALGFVVLPILAALIAEHSGWRVAWVCTGLIVFVLGVPTAWLLLLARPELVRQRVDGDRTEEEARRASRVGRSSVTEAQWTLREALRTPTLWVLLVALGIQGISSNGVTVHLVPHLEEEGWTVTQATLTFTVGGSIMALSGFFWGPLADRIHTRVLFALSNLVLMAFVACLILLTASPWMVFITGVFMGLGYGGFSLVTRLALPNFFGRASAGAIQGFATPFQVLVSGAGALLAGALFMATGGYDVPFWLFVGLMGVATIVVWWVPTPSRSARA